MRLGRTNLRKAIGLVAVLGMVMHAGLLARHHMMVLAAAFGPSSGISLAGVICRGDGTVTRIADLNGPATPSNSDMQTKCPICLGMVGASAVISEPVCMVVAREPISERILIVGERIAERIGTRLPPSRAPPAQV